MDKQLDPMHVSQYRCGIDATTMPSSGPPPARGIYRNFAIGLKSPGVSPALSDLPGSNQLRQGLSFIDDISRPALVIEIRRVERHAHVVINGRGEITRSHGTFGDFSAVAR